MAAKRQRAKGGISSSIEDEENYERNTEDETDPDRANNDENPLQLWEEGVGRSYEQQLN